MTKTEGFGVTGSDGTYGLKEAVVIADKHVEQKLVSAELLAWAA